MSKTNLDKAMDQVRKLLKLANSSNPHEAAVAAAKAQEVIDRFHLSMDRIEQDEASEEETKHWANDPIYRGRWKVEWKSRLASSIARSNACKMVFGYGGDLCLVGRASDVTIVRQLFALLVTETERLAKRECTGLGKTYNNNFKLGVVDTISAELRRRQKEVEEKLAEEAKQQDEQLRLAGETGTALVNLHSALEMRQAAALAARSYTERGWTTHHYAESRSDNRARAHGQIVGKEVSFTQNRIKG